MKKLASKQKPKTSNMPKQRIAYVTPAVIYEGQITARAGSVIGDKPDGGAVDPTDLFGNN